MKREGRFLNGLFDIVFVIYNFISSLMAKHCLIIFLLLAVAPLLQAQQNCTHPGQTPVRL